MREIKRTGKSKGGGGRRMGINITLHKQVVFITSLCSLYYNFSTAVVSGIQRHAQCAHVETEAAQQHQTRLQKLCDNFWSRVWFCCSRVRTNQKKVVKTTFQFQAIFPNQTLHQKDVTESAPLWSRRE